MERSQGTGNRLRSYIALKPDISLGASLAVIALDYGVYQLNMPPMADIRSSAPHNDAISASLKAADWTAIGMCAALSLVARDPNLFIFGAGFAVALHWFYTHSNMSHPLTGEVTMPPVSGSAGGVNAAGY